MAAGGVHHRFAMRTHHEASISSPLRCSPPLLFPLSPRHPRRPRPRRPAPQEDLVPVCDRHQPRPDRRRARPRPLPPITTANFLHYVDTHRFDGQTFYRCDASAANEGNLIQGEAFLPARRAQALPADRARTDHPDWRSQCDRGDLDGQRRSRHHPRRLLHPTVRTCRLSTPMGRAATPTALLLSATSPREWMS